MTNTTKTTTLKTAENLTNPLAFCFWDTESIFAANFMFPTEHFKDVKELESMGNEEFHQLIETMLSASQPLGEVEQKALVKSVHSCNHLRLYYQAYTIAARTLSQVNSLVTNEQDIASFDSEEDIKESFEYRGHSIIDEDALMLHAIDDLPK